ncbi:MAG TPA: STAS/SEC14 domain-containing protein [Bryobacteraceae bacterium]|nr:STAS/SEC14 domain-containing protein [Bryobacteraceae bacterium]
MIEALEGFPDKILAFACQGRVTKSDYEGVLIPAVEQALKEPGKVRLYYQINADFSGIDPGAMWDDFKVGMEHILRWERIAVVADVDWIRNTVRAFSFVMPGMVKVFRLDEAAKAREWISANMTK